MVNVLVLRLHQTDKFCFLLGRESLGLQTLKMAPRRPAVPINQGQKTVLPLCPQVLQRTSGPDINQAPREITAYPQGRGAGRGSGQRCRNQQIHEAPTSLPHDVQPLGSEPSALPFPGRQQLRPQPLAPLKTKGENLSVFLGHFISHRAIISIFPFLCKSGYTQPAWPNQRLPVPSPTQPTLGLLCSLLPPSPRAVGFSELWEPHMPWH